jgi:alkanesulfonate monooxygenase SsuD/methylene tetrahydromethanopterin reductase-like flavin-dependent oxidoreductase (luciferase family)
MDFDIFFSISQTPVRGFMPGEAEMFRNFFDQVTLADELGYGTAWIAESHLSSEAQKHNKDPVIPHWQGEVGLNVDFLQSAHQIFRRTSRIEAGSAVMNILTMGGPIAHAERINAFLGFHGLDPQERRRIHIGFSAGRFDFMNRALGVYPRSEWESLAHRVLKGKIFEEACEIFLRLLRGETLSSQDVPIRSMQRSDFRSSEEWLTVAKSAGVAEDAILPVPKRWDFEPLKIVPQDPRRELLQLVAGSHDPRYRSP